MDNYNNNGYNNDSLNNPQGNGPDPQQNNYSNQGYQQPYGTDNNQGYQQPYGTDNNQGYQQQSYGANDYQQPYGSQPDYSNYNQNNYQQQYPNYNQYPVEDKSAKNNATASLVLGIIGLCCCAPCGIVGLILGINSKKAKPENNGLATVLYTSFYRFVLPRLWSDKGGICACSRRYSAFAKAKCFFSGWNSYCAYSVYSVRTLCFW